jgi:hypothetical protein
MSSKRQTLSSRLRFGKWAGFYFGTLAALAHQQIVAITVYARCPVNSDVLVLGVGAVCAIIGAFGAVYSWRTREALPREDTASTTLRADRFVATLAAAFAAFCVLFILFATTAGLILRCER